MRVAAVLMLILAAGVAGCVGNDRPPPSAATAPLSSSPDQDRQPCLFFVVVDEELLPIPFANVTIDELDLVLPTNSAGQAKACGIPNGSLHIAVAAPGYDTARKTVQTPVSDPVRFTLRLLPVLVPYHEILPKSLFYTFSFSTIDATLARFVPLDDLACSPCSFEFVASTMPDFVYWEARWARASQPVPSEDQMYHIFRGGIPFENAPGDTADRDIGSGAMGLPFHFQYHRNDMVRAPPVAQAAQAGGEVPFSGAMYCWGNPPSPCVNQRIDVYLTVWFNILKVPDGYTALPDT